MHNVIIIAIIYVADAITPIQICDYSIYNEYMLWRSCEDVDMNKRQLRVFFLPRYFKPKVYVYPMAGSKYEILVSRVGVLASIVSFFRK